MYFNGDQALHNSYWHDEYGIVRSAGCVNLSPHDAHWLFHWAFPDRPNLRIYNIDPEVDPTIWVYVHDRPLDMDELLTLQFDGNFTMTLSPANGDTAFNLVDGGNFVTNNTGTVRINVASASSQASIAGNPSFHNLTLTRLSSGRGVVDFMGSSLTISNQLQMNTTTTFNVEDKTVNIGAIVFTNTSSTVTEQLLNFTGSTVVIGSALPFVSNGTATFGTINFTNATVTVLGNLNPRQGDGANAWSFTGSTVIFAGSSLQTVSGTLNFADVIVNNDAIVEIAPVTVTVNSLTNSGTIQQTQDVTGVGDFTFLGLGSYGGVILNNAAGSDLGQTEVTIRGNQICNVGNELINRCFDISPTTNSGLNATVTFFWSQSELNGNACASMNAYRWNGAAWDLPLTLDGSYGDSQGRDCPQGLQSLRVREVTAFSPFGVKSGVAPTAVSLATFSAATNQVSTPLILLLLLIPLAGASLFFWRRAGSPA
jgi:hypothetical protein